MARHPAEQNAAPSASFRITTSDLLIAGVPLLAAGFFVAVANAADGLSAKQS